MVLHHDGLQVLILQVYLPYVLLLLLGALLAESLLAHCIPHVWLCLAISVLAVLLVACHLLLIFPIPLIFTINIILTWTPTVLIDHLLRV